MNEVVIIVPIYKSLLDELENISLSQLIKTLGNYDIVFIAPYKINLEKYPSIIRNYKIQKFDNHFFESINGYNQLMLDVNFYKKFDAYKFMLLYQLDCLVFRDELLDFCRLNYDYIAAPWPAEDVGVWLKDKRYPVELRVLGGLFFKYGKGYLVGNGGLSLRKISSFIFNINLFKIRLKRWGLNEDIFFSHYIPTFNPFFRIAPLSVALKFGVDKEPEKHLTASEGILPFSCHGWSKNDEIHYKGVFRFWKPIVKKMGYELT